MTSPDPKFVVSHRPVNQRTTPHAPADKAVHPQVQERIKAMKAKLRFGVPLAEQLQRQEKKPLSLTRSPATMVAVFSMALSGLAMLFALIEKSLLVSGIATFGMLLGGLTWFRTSSSRLSNFDADASVAPLFDRPSLNAFDQALELISHELDAQVDNDIEDQLKTIKAQVIRIAQVAHQTQTGESLTFDDKHYLSESLRRYLPDALQSYLAIPLSARHDKHGPDNASSKDALQRQLALLQQEYDRCEQRLNQGAAEQLLRQQRFLEAKNQRSI
jgi:hypothetical protein